ncbi:MAG TPA: glycosyltransferase family 2 protein [Terriglobales bacterium]|nr:glycosyltransferase family 2 protein [Terriglobales bacterium]
MSIVVPCFNEEGCVDEMMRRLLAALEALACRWEIVLVDDGSRDGTLAAMRRHAEADARIGYVSFSRNFGHQMALWAGMERARGDAVVSLDGDLQHPPELIPELFELWRRGYDVVYTVREGNEGHALKELVSAGFYWLLRKLTGVEVPTGGADFRLLDRKVVDALLACDERFIFVRGLVPWLGFKRKAVAYKARERFAGSTKYVLTRMFKFALDGIFSFSTVPLRLISFLGVATIALGILYGLYSIWIRVFTDAAATGWTSLVVLVLVFSGTQLLSLGILSEYVGRIYEEVKHRPRYIVAEAQQPAPDINEAEASS